MVDRKLEALNDRALLVWSPTNDIPDNKLEEYIAVAKEKYGYNGEQALGMLFWHKHDLERAVLDLSNFTPFPDEWSEEDKVSFFSWLWFHPILPCTFLLSIAFYLYRSSISYIHWKTSTFCYLLYIFMYSVIFHSIPGSRSIFSLDIFVKNIRILTNNI